MAQKVEGLAVGAVLLDRLQPARWNPRTIKDERFQNLVRSIQADPDFLWRRPILATADGTICAGNMRYRAALHQRPARVRSHPASLSIAAAAGEAAGAGGSREHRAAST